jgi:hypothetical protein
MHYFDFEQQPRVGQDEEELEILENFLVATGSKNGGL